MNERSCSHGQAPGQAQRNRDSARPPEDLGAFGAVLDDAGYEVGVVDVGIDDLTSVDPLGPDLLIILEDR